MSKKNSAERNDSIRHPNWYLKKYDLIFSRGTDYDEEIRLVNEISPLYGKYIQEIGAGTGEHAVRILKYRPRILELVDLDVGAAEHLKNRFANVRNLAVSNKDGFNSCYRRRYDIIICMYSVILQHIGEPGHFCDRVSNLLNRMNEEGTVFFEIVDANISKAIYPNGISNKIYEGDNGMIRISSHYSDNTIVIKFFGTIEGNPIDYQVKLLSITRREVEKLLHSVGVSDLGHRELDEFGRRILFFASK